ncbi:MAG: carboxylating nicotinate-nucleotide diphosphorylase [Planctomycetota bacterium]|nr:carboxylating nicotinate-nucleotide diphosphorylase [Planctomycetota bacterium]
MPAKADFFEQAELPPLRDRLRAALLEDLGTAGDVTSQAVVPQGRMAQADVLVKANGVLSGVELLREILPLAQELVRPRHCTEQHDVRVSILRSDGAHVAKGDVVASMAGEARVLLAAERLSLNFLCHLSGIATHTAQYVAKVAHTKAKIVDTRKTTPLWRDLEKHAVTCGGAENHRRGLYDMILIKDNHLALWGVLDPAGAVRAARERFPQVAIEVEVTDVAGLAHVCAHSQPDMVLLDNFSLGALREAVQWREHFFSREKKSFSRGPLLEASGCVNLESVAAIAETGVDRISVGALTHSVTALDISLELRL